MKANEDFTILIVDDIPENLQVLGSILDNHGYTISFAQNGKEAIEQAEEIKFDLILCDVMMPVMDGFQAADHLKANKATKDIPIIFLTAKNDRESIIEGFTHGASDYVTKPFDANELMARVQTHLLLKYQADQLAKINVILEKKVQERTLQLVNANEKLELAYSELSILDQAKNNFLQLISHELRTPLNAIVGSISLMEDLVDQYDDLLEYFDLLRSGVERLEKFSSTALLITQLSSGAFTFRTEIIHVKLTLNEIIESLEPFASMRNVLIVNNITSDKICNVEVVLFSKVIYSIIH
ncbi:MAG: hybrid sensor histidine kinase/response regulator, partial [Bacteroidales bacterium]|nr:hybrid sensor histidine kinase/response regulator [Bacteroidales bacterium]